MTEQNLDQNSIAPISTQEKPAERLVPQSEVNETLGVEKIKARNKGFDDGYRKALEELQAQKASSNASDMGMPVAQTTAPTQMGNPVSPSIDQAQLQANIMAELEKKRQQEAAIQQANQIDQQMASKTEDAKARYPDFDEIAGTIDYRKAPHVYMALNLADNAGDLMYHLGKNPRLFNDIENSLRNEQWEAARRQIMDLSGSIKQNQEAGKLKMPPEPFSQVKAIPVSDNGERSLKDIKRDPRYRF